MKTLKELQLKNKFSSQNEIKNQRVLVRCDFNVPLDEKGQISDDFRIRKTIPTIEYLIKKEAKVILMSHLGDPQGKKVEKLRLTPIQEKLMEYLDVSITKAADCIGKEIEDYVSEMQIGEILLLENLRFHKEEEENDEKFAKQLAGLGDFYINEAFPVCHRNHASIVGVPKFLPSAIGLLFEEEIKILSKLLENPEHPFVVIIGGAKIFSKIGVISQFLEKADHLLLGGKIANSILQAKGIIIGKPILETELVKMVEKIDLTSPKMHLPVDGAISLQESTEDYFRVGAIGRVKKEENVFDIGPETIKIFSEILKGSKISFKKGGLEYIERKEVPKTILWVGPLGMFENEKFEKGTKEIANIIIRNHTAFKIAGGGDTISAINKFALLDKFNHISTGGSAMLKFLSKEKLPGIEALK